MKTIPTPDPKAPAVAKMVRGTRRQERDRLRKAATAATKRDVAAAHAAQQMVAALNDPEQVKARTQRNFSSTLVEKLRTRLAAAISIEKALSDKHPALSIEAVHTLTNGGSLETGGMGVEAYTDFRSININIEEGAFPDPYGVGTEIVDFIATVRGVFHHEAGHILHTVPLRDLGRDFDDEVRDGQHVELNERLSALIGEAPVGMDPRDATHRYTAVHGVWNMIEDQRMESVRVRDFPACNRYFDHLVYDLLAKERDPQWWAKSWFLLAGREYLPLDIWDMSSHMFIRDADPLEWLTIVRDYKAATTTEGLIRGIVEAAEFMAENKVDADDGDAQDGQVGEHGQGQGNGTQQGDGRTGAGDGASAPGDGSGGDNDKDGEGELRKPTEDPDTLDAGQGVAGEYFSTTPMQDAIKKMKASESDELLHAPEVDGALEAAGYAGLRQYDGPTQPMAGYHLAEAQALATGIQQALETYVTQSTPTWQLDVEEGVLDPCAYRTREPGELNYNVGMDGSIGEVLDLHVSVLADVSYSMSSHMAQLSTMLLGMKLAVDELKISNNFTIWSDDPANHAIYTDGPEEVIFPALGGTDPSTALTDALVRNEEQRPHHLVLILTDGHWYNLDSVNQWRHSKEQQFIVVKWGQGPRDVHGADALIDLPKLTDFPKMLEDALDRMLASIV